MAPITRINGGELKLHNSLGEALGSSRTAKNGDTRH
jgi:hypothetical protein